MGILDDAIREHLELKRQHGVPEDELQRQEDEALGPARRDVAQQPEDDAELAPAQTATAEADEPAPEETALEETALFDMEGDASEAEAEAAAPVAPATEEHEVPEDAAAREETAILEEGAIYEGTAIHEETAIHEPAEPVEPAAAAEPTPAEPTPVEPPPVEPPPVEPDPDDDRLGETQPHGFEAVEDELDEEGEEEEVLASDPEQEDLDVLEDTPDFLQETPEHDRLWFEQKPPRDFDFD